MFIHNWKVKPHRGSQRKMWSRVVNDIFEALELNKDEWLEDCGKGNSSAKAFLSCVDEHISEREGREFRKGLDSKVK